MIIILTIFVYKDDHQYVLQNNTPTTNNNNKTNNDNDHNNSYTEMILHPLQRCIGTSSEKARANT